MDSVFPYAGASSVYSSEPLQRCFRDLHTAGQHIYVGAEAWKRCARIALGIDGRHWSLVPFVIGAAVLVIHYARELFGARMLRHA